MILLISGPIRKKWDMLNCFPLPLGSSHKDNSSISTRLSLTFHGWMLPTGNKQKKLFFFFSYWVLILSMVFLGKRHQPTLNDEQQSSFVELEWEQRKRKKSFMCNLPSFSKHNQRKKTDAISAASQVSCRYCRENAMYTSVSHLKRTVCATFTWIHRWSGAKLTSTVLTALPTGIKPITEKVSIKYINIFFSSLNVSLLLV